MRRNLPSAMIALFLLGTSGSPVFAQFCGCFAGGPPPTLSAQVSAADHVYLAKWVSSSRWMLDEREETDDAADEETAEGESAEDLTTFEIVDSLKGPATALRSVVAVVGYHAGKPGDLFLLFGAAATAADEDVEADDDRNDSDENKSIDWSPMSTSPAACRYLQRLIRFEQEMEEASSSKRLTFFIPYLEHSDEFVAYDAFDELEQAAPEDVAILSESLPRERLRFWLSSPKTEINRIGLYATMLGWCGEKNDARLLRSLMLKDDSEDSPFVVDGLMTGYLILTGEKGLDFLDAKILKNRSVGFDKRYGALLALRYMWQSARPAIGRERFQKSFRLFLEDSDVADLVIADLSRMRFWELQDQVVQLYDADGFGTPSIRRAIVRYLQHSADSLGQITNELAPEHVMQARRHLADLELRDPETVKSANRLVGGCIF